MHRNVSSFLLLIFTVWFTQHATSQEERDVLEFLPGGKIFPSFTADALTHQISISHLTHNREWIGTIGGSIPLAQVTLADVMFQIGAAASTFNRLIMTPGLTVYTIDYKVDLPLDIRVSATSFRLAFGHYSCHFADDGIELLGKHSIQYVKDYVLVGAGRDISSIGGHVYAASQVTYHNVPIRSKHLMVQFGCEAGNISVSSLAQLYSAIDIKLKQEVSWGTTQSYQLGVKLFMKGIRSLRLAYTLRRGFDERGQFFDQRENASIISTFIDF